MPRRYPPEFRRRVLDLIASGRKVADVARDLGVSGQTIYNWQKQDLIDRGERPGLRSDELAELQAARRRIAALEAELAATRRAQELLKEAMPPKGRFGVADRMVAEGHAVQVCCRVLAVSESGFYAHRGRAPSPRAIRHAWLTDLITQVHAASNGTYGAPRVRAELVLGRRICVGHNAVAMLMHRAGLKGLPGTKRPQSRHETPTAGDLVDRAFARTGPNQLWVTDITEHPTREGKVYCAVVLDAFSRRVVGWSIDTSPSATLATNALGMAIEQRDAQRGETVIHSDHGTQGGFNRSWQHLVMEVVRDGWWQASGGDSCDARADMVAGAAVGCAARGPGPLLGRDRPWSVERGCRCCGWGVAGGRVEVVSPGWRDAANLVGSGVGAVSVLCRAGRDRDPSRPTCRGARDRSPTRSVGVDDLEGTAPQRVD